MLLNGLNDCMGTGCPNSVKHSGWTQSIGGVKLDHNICSGIERSIDQSSLTDDIKQTLGIYVGGAPRDVYVTPWGCKLSVPAGQPSPVPGSIAIVTQETRDIATGKVSGPSNSVTKQPWFFPVLAVGGVAILFIFIKRHN